MDNDKFYWVSTGVQIHIPDEHILTALRLLLIEKLKVRMFLMSKVFDGGERIRIPLNYDER